MSAKHRQIFINTTSGTDVIDITTEVSREVQESGVVSGAVTLKHNRLRKRRVEVQIID
ncbi:conserved hypothetical protein [delta proteobacterium NaphS2]|nr:conserved hypothetical protein [delta proteobacterium NaphS2]